MILPNNGKVVIIDDQPKDVEALIAALSKEKVPFVHYKEEDLSDLPDTPIENVRLIFLDLELITDNYTGQKNITSPIKTRLMKIIKPKTPYALVIWSKKEDDYKASLLKDFDNDFIDYKPIFHTSLPKADIIGKKGAMDIIKKELAKEITRFKSFNAFLVWESLVNEASGKLTNEIATLNPPDADWNKKNMYLLYKLAVAYSGKAVNDFDNIKQLKNALYTLTLSFTDNIEYSINKVIDGKFAGFVNKDPHKTDNFTTVINKLLLVSENSDDVSQPGNIFFPFFELEKCKRKIDELYNSKKECILLLKSDFQEAATNNLDKKYQIEIQKVDDKERKMKSKLNEITVSSLLKEGYSDETIKNEILDNAIPIELNITPLCDYAQMKAKLFRILPGVFINDKYRKHFNTKPAYVYITDAAFKIDGVDYLFLFDFRFLYSQTKKEIDTRFVKYRLKQQLLSDIQIKLGAHVNRAGILYLS